MDRDPKKYLPFDYWPPEDRRRWEGAFKSCDFLDDAGAGSHLATKSRAALKAAYSLWLGFLCAQHPGRFQSPSTERVDRPFIVEYVAYMRGFYRETSIVTSLHHLRLALRLLYPDVGWTWLLVIAKRLAAQARPMSAKHHLVTSERLYALGIALMDEAIAAEADETLKKTRAEQYRDGLMIAVLAAIPLRRRTFAALQIGKQLVRSGQLWALDIPGEDVKNRRPLEFTISAPLSARLDMYLNRFRKDLLGSEQHAYLWVASTGRPMSGDSIYCSVKRRTGEAFGFPVNLHRFRHAAATFWSVRDPENVRGSKDLLGHVSFKTTEKHYNMTQSRMAGRTLAQILDDNHKHSHDF